MVNEDDIKGETDLTVSVIVPVYDDLNGLADTIASLQNQSIPASSFEIIVVNDGGAEDIKAYCGRHNVKCINITPNSGSYNARNMGIQAAGAVNLAFIDADAIADNNWLKNGLRHLKNYDYVAGDVRVIFDKVNDMATYHDYLTAFPIKEYFDAYGFGVTGNLFLRSQILQTTGMFNPTLRSGGDFEFGSRVGTYPAISKIFAADCIVYHPPRNHAQKVIKLKRVRQGQQSLIELNEERFGFLRANTALNFKLLLPPRWAAVNKLYDNDARYSKQGLFWYMYKLRLLTFFNNMA